MDVWGVVFTPPVGCSRLLSAVNVLTATNFKNLESREVLWKDGTHNGSVRSFMSLFTWAQLRTFLCIVMSSTRNRSIATMTCWRKNLMMGAIAGISRLELAWVVLLQILGVDGLMWSTHRWSQNDFSPVRFFQIYWERSTNSFCIESTLLASFDRWNLSARPCPSGCRLLQFDQFRVEIHEI